MWRKISDSVLLILFFHIQVSAQRNLNVEVKTRTGQPLEQIRIEISEKGIPLFEKKTDEKGFVSFQLPSRFYSGDTISITVKIYPPENYSCIGPDKKSIMVNPNGQTISTGFTLEKGPLLSRDIRFHFKDGVLLEDASHAKTLQQSIELSKSENGIVLIAYYLKNEKAKNGKKRAKLLKQYLIKKGIPESKIKIGSPQRCEVPFELKPGEQLTTEQLDIQYYQCTGISVIAGFDN